MTYEKQARSVRCGGCLCILAAIGTGAPYAEAQDDEAQRQQQILFNGQVQVPPGKRYPVTFTTCSLTCERSGERNWEDVAWVRE